MKILNLNNYYPEHTGGIEFVTLNLTKHYRQNNRVRWMACDVPPHPHIILPDDIPLKALNFTETHLGFPYPIPIGNAVGEIFRQVAWCDVLHIQDCLYSANVVAFIASRLYRKPVLVTQHISPIPYKEAYKNVLQTLAYYTIGKMVLENAEKIVFISQRVKNWFSERMRFSSEPELIINGVDHEIFFPASSDERKEAKIRLGFSEDDIVLIFVGRFTQKKGLDIIKKISQECPSYQWLMIGRSSEYDPNEWNFPNIKVYPPQTQAELRNYYIASDLLVLLSVGEGFPLVVQEAMSCGTPAAVSAEIYGYLPDAPLIKLENTNTLDILDSLSNLFENGNDLGVLRDKTTRYAQQWDWGIVAQKYEDLLNTLVENRHRGL